MSGDGRNSSRRLRWPSVRIPSAPPGSPLERRLVSRLRISTTFPQLAYLRSRLLRSSRRQRAHRNRHHQKGKSANSDHRNPSTGSRRAAKIIRTDRAKLIPAFVALGTTFPAGQKRGASCPSEKTAGFPCPTHAGHFDNRLSRGDGTGATDARADRRRASSSVATVQRTKARAEPSCPSDCSHRPIPAPT